MRGNLISKIGSVDSSVKNKIDSKIRLGRRTFWFASFLLFHVVLHLIYQTINTHTTVPFFARLLYYMSENIQKLSLCSKSNKLYKFKVLLDVFLSRHNIGFHVDFKYYYYVKYFVQEDNFQLYKIRFKFVNYLLLRTLSSCVVLVDFWCNTIRVEIFWYGWLLQ